MHSIDCWRGRGLRLLATCGLTCLSCLQYWVNNILRPLHQHCPIHKCIQALTSFCSVSLERGLFTFGQLHMYMVISLFVVLVLVSLSCFAHSASPPIYAWRHRTHSRTCATFVLTAPVARLSLWWHLATLRVKSRRRAFWGKLERVPESAHSYATWPARSGLARF